MGVIQAGFGRAVRRPAATAGYKGDPGPFTAPGYTLEETGERTTVKAVQHGDRRLEERRLREGDAMPGGPAGCTIERVAVERQEGGAVRITYSGSFATPPRDKLPSSSGPELVEETCEVDWSAVEKAIETHPRYRDLASGYLAVGTLVQAYFATAETGAREKILAEIEASEGEGKNLAVELLKLKLAGHDTYARYFPVARRTRVWKNQPSLGGPGTIETPLCPYVPGYAYMKTAHRAQRDAKGRWTTVEEWTGSEGVSNALYPVPRADYTEPDAPDLTYSAVVT
jgi:hypothetical protein